MRSGGLWRHPDFLKLWAGETVSLVGSQITLLALPLVAVLTLQATPVQMGVLQAAQYAPFLLIGLPAGAWVDRLRRRPILIGANLGRAMLLATVPLLAFLGLLRVEHLLALAFLVGILTVFFDVAYQAFVPVLVRRENLVEGNSTLEASRSFAQVAGPNLGGILVQFLTAPLAVAVDATSYLVSAVSLSLIRAPEPRPSPPEQGRSIRDEIGEGLGVVFGNPVLRAAAGCTGTWNLCSAAVQAVHVLYATRELSIEPAILGLIFGAGGLGGLLGAVLAGQAARRTGLGPALAGAACLGVTSNLLIPLAGQSPPMSVPMLMAAQFIGPGAGTAYNIIGVTLRQAITPNRLQGRVNATMLFPQPYRGAPGQGGR